MRASCLAFYLALAAGPALAQPVAPDLAARVDSVFARYDAPTTPGCAVSVIRGGEAVLRRVYGMVRLGFGVPMTPATTYFPEQARELLVQFHGFKDSYDDMTFMPPHLGTITMRTRIVHGDRDEVFPVEMLVRGPSRIGTGDGRGDRVLSNRRTRRSGVVLDLRARKAQYPASNTASRSPVPAR